MQKVSVQKNISFITLTAFIFGAIVAPINIAMSAGPYQPDPNFDPSQYQIEGIGSPGDPQNDPTEAYLQDRTNYNLNIGNIAEAIPAVIGCTGIVNKVQNSLSNFVGSGNKASSVVQNGATGSFDSSHESSGHLNNSNSEIEGAGTSNTGFGQEVPTTEKSAIAIKESVAAQEKLKQQEKTREECLNGIAYSLAKAQLAKMTQITVNWINSGFNGDALYIKDRNSYFQSLADGQLLRMVGPLANIQNRLIYPFGRDTATTIINSRKYGYEDRAQSTLQNSLRSGATTEDFANDFSVGGWDGWFSLTQNDQNNPIGFGIMTGQELAKRISQEKEDTQSELLENNGFLSQRQCVEYEKNPGSSSDLGQFTGYQGNRTSGASNPRCLRWETVTPGKLISDQASYALTSNIRQLELADSLNESLSAVFQALINQMISQGLSSLSSFSPQNAPQTFGGAGYNKVFDSLGNEISNLYGNGPGQSVLTVNKGTGWYNSGKAFDITTDLEDIYRVADGKRYLYKKGVITTQKDYAEVVKLSLIKVPKILPALGELDYCIPGPNANWENSAKEIINGRIEYLRSLYFNGKGAVIAPFEDPLQPAADFASSMSPSFSFVRGLIVSNKRKYEAERQRQADDRIIAKEATFERQRAEALQQEVDQFKWYKERVDSIYGPESPMRSPGNPWYIPMAEAGLQATKYIREYDRDIQTATADYKDLINQTNSNVYKLTVIRNEVRTIVAKARARRELEMMNKGLPAIDPSCYDINPGNKPNDPNIGTTGGGSNPGSQRPNDPNAKPTTGTNTTTNNPTGGLKPNSTTSSAKPDFSLTIKEDKSTCEAIVIGTNKTTGQVVDTTWGLQISNEPNIYSQKSKDYNATFSTSRQSGDATMTLSVKGLDGKTNSLSKIIKIPTRTITSNGTVCPK